MRKVTKIEVQKNNKKRVNVFLDGEFFLGMDYFTLLSQRIKVGQEIDEDKIAEIVFEADFSTAYEKALGYVSKMMRTKMQMIIYLKNKGYDGKIIARVIDKLIEIGFIDDENFAKKFVAEKKNSQGKRKLSYELKQKGVKEDIIEAELQSVGDEFDACYQVAKKKVKDKPLDQKEKERCYRYVLSRGFSYETAKAVVERIEKENEDNLS